MRPWCESDEEAQTHLCCKVTKVAVTVSWQSVDLCRHCQSLVILESGRSDQWCDGVCVQIIQRIQTQRVEWLRVEWLALRDSTVNTPRVTVLHSSVCLRNAEKWCKQERVAMNAGFEWFKWMCLQLVCNWKPLKTGQTYCCIEWTVENRELRTENRQHNRQNWTELNTTEQSLSSVLVQHSCY